MKTITIGTLTTVVRARDNIKDCLFLGRSAALRLLFNFWGRTEDERLKSVAGLKYILDQVTATPERAERFAQALRDLDLATDEILAAEIPLGTVASKDEHV